VSLCLLAAGQLLSLAGTAFTLSWTHSVERVRWEEDWRLTPAGLELVEARIAGSGAGMEPPEGAVLSGGVWHYAPDLPPQERLVLAASGATEGGWRLCAAGSCTEFGAQPGTPAVIAPCAGNDR
jgi:hypothetical protein